MSRSRKKNPVHPHTTAKTDKPFKTIEHKRERAAVRVALAADDATPHPKEFGDPWRSQKDGKRFFDPKELPQFLRK